MDNKNTLAQFQKKPSHKGDTGIQPEREKIRRDRINLKDRWFSAFLFLPALIIIAWAGDIYFLILIELGIGLGTYEFFHILKKRGLDPYTVFGVVAALILGINSYFQSHIFTFITPSALIFATCLFELFRKEKGNAIFHISTTVFGVMYVGWLMSHLILLMEMPKVVTPHIYYNIFHFKIRMGTSFALLPFALTWMNDTFAFYIGRKFGKHPFFQKISPKKTSEGVIGGAIFAIIGTFIYRYIYGPYLSSFDCIALGGLTAILSPLGDLTESMFKRDVDIKDSSDTIPGHGGILDRFDSLLFTAPVIYYYLRFFAAR